MRTFHLVVALLVVGCNARAPDSGATSMSVLSETAPAPSDEPAPGASPAIVDICKAYDKDAPVCALLGDGRVACAHVQADHFEPPLAGIREAVEIACGDHGVCVREASGAVTCLDAKGELRKPEDLARARSLAGDCAVLEQGGLACWDENWTIEPRKLPRLAAALGGDDAEKLDLLRAGLPPMGSDDGCVLHSSGELWCWGYTANGGEAKPSKVHTFEQPAKVSELMTSGPKICWREDAGWQCTDAKSPPQPSLECDHTPCTCMFYESGFCGPLGERKPDPEMTVEDVVQRTNDCAVDSSGRVWCQNWYGLPPVSMRLTLEGETTQLAAFVGEPPTPEPSPLPDPATAKCPAGASVINQLCGPLRQPGAALACQPGARTCPCNAQLQWLDEDACDPEGFQFINAAGYHGGSSDRHTFLVHVDGAKVGLGPELYLDVEDIEWGDTATLFEFVDERDEGDMFSYYESKLEAVVICARVDGRPACSAPLVRSLDFTQGWGGHEYEEDTTQTMRYHADLQVVGERVKVKVKSKKGKVEASELPGFESLRCLKSGTYAFAELLDQPFVQAPE